MAPARRTPLFWTLVFGVPIALSALLPLWQAFFVGRNVLVRGRVMGDQRVILRDATIACLVHVADEWIAFEPQRTTSSGNYILRIPIDVFESGADRIVVHAWSEGYGHERIVLTRAERSFGVDRNDIVLAPGATLRGTVAPAQRVGFRRVADDGVPEIEFYSDPAPDGAFERPNLRAGDVYDVIAPEGCRAEPAQVTITGEPVTITLHP